MAIEAARLQVVVDADTSKAVGELRSMDGQVQKTNTSFAGLSNSVKTFAVGGGILAAGNAMMGMAKAAADDAASVDRLNQAVINAEGSLAGHTAVINDAIAAGQQMAFTDDQTRAALSLMTAQTGDADEALRRLSTAQNLARGAGIDLATAAKLIGKTSDENTSALSRMGIAVSDAATAQDVLNAVDQKFAGQAGAFAETDAAKFARAADSIDEMKESIGAGLLPVIISVVEPITQMTTGITQMNTALGQVLGNGDGAAGSISLFGSALAAANPLQGAFTGAIGLMGDGLEWAGVKADDATPKVQSFADQVRIAAIAQAESEQAIAANNAALNAAGTEYERFTTQQAIAEQGFLEVAAAAEATRDAYGRQAEAAGLANERNTEFFQSVELGSGAVAEAAYNLSQLAEATETAWAAQDKLTGIWGEAQKEMGFWETNLSNAQGALAILDEEMAENGSLTVEQQRQYDALTVATGRYAGGVEDTEGAVVDAAIAQADFIATQDELNGKLANGEISQRDYNVEMGKAAGAIDPATGAAYNLATAQDSLALAIDGTVNKLGNLLIDLGVLPESKRTEFSTPGMPEAQADTTTLQGKYDGLPASKETAISAPGAVNAAIEIGNMGEGIGALPSSFTVTATLDASQYFATIETMGNMMPRSPAKEGPFKKLPDFSYLTENMDKQLLPGAERAAALAASYMPMNSPAEQGPLSQTPDWAFLFVGLDAEAENYAERAAQTIAAFVGGINLDSILSDQIDLDLSIGKLQALFDGFAQLGDTAATSAIAPELTRMRAEAEALAIVIGTDAVQAWIANQNAAQAAAEAAEAALAAQEAAVEAAAAAAEAALQRVAAVQAALSQTMLDAVAGLTAGGAATGSFFEGLIADYETAKAAVQMGELLGLPDDVMAQLQADLDAVGGLFETSAVFLEDALRNGMLDEATLQALAESGGEWFETIYDQLFGEGALSRLEAGWGDIADVSVDALAALLPSMEDGGAAIMDTLVDAISSGALSFEEGLALLADATGEQVTGIIEELQRLEAALVVQLAEALIAGTDPSGIEANLSVIEQLLASLAGRAVDTADTVRKAFSGQGMGMLSGVADSSVQAADALDTVGQSMERVASRASDAGERIEIGLTQQIQRLIIGTQSLIDDFNIDNFDEQMARLAAAAAVSGEDIHAVIVSLIDGFEVQLQAALLAGTDPTGLIANIEMAMRFLAGLEAQAAKTAGMLATGALIASAKANGANQNWVQGANGVWRYDARAAAAAPPPALSGGRGSLDRGNDGSPVTNVYVTLDGKQVAESVTKRQMQATRMSPGLVGG